MNIEQRIERYQQDVEQWKNIHKTMCNPSFNVDHSPRTFEYFESLSQHLKKEAEELWQLGINVYK